MHIGFSCFRFWYLCIFLIFFFVFLFLLLPFLVNKRSILHLNHWWTPQDHTRRGRSRNTWTRDLKQEMWTEGASKTAGERWRWQYKTEVDRDTLLHWVRLSMSSKWRCGGPLYGPGLVAIISRLAYQNYGHDVTSKKTIVKNRVTAIMVTSRARRLQEKPHQTTWRRSVASIKHRHPRCRAVRSNGSINCRHE